MEFAELFSKMGTQALISGTISTVEGSSCFNIFFKLRLSADKVAQSKPTRSVCACLKYIPPTGKSVAQELFCFACMEVWALLSGIF